MVREAAADEPVVRWVGWPHAPLPVGAALASRRRGVVAVVDESGRPVRVGPLRLCWEAGRAVALRLWLWGLCGLAALLTSRRRPAPDRAGQAAADGKVALVLPVLPDLSHTFVYREVRAILRARPDWVVVALRRNDAAPVHPEARDLLARTRFLPRRGVAASGCLLLRGLLSRRGRQLVSLYRSQPGGSARDLFSRQALRDASHPGNAFALAARLRSLGVAHVHVYSSTHPANVAMGAALLCGLPFSISSYVDFDFDYSHKMLAEKAQRAAFFRVVTAYCRERLLSMPALAGLPRERFPVVYLGLDLHEWPRRGPTPRQGVLVSAARLVPKKGLHLVPEALASLKAQGLACRWRVFGDGPERPRIEALCRKFGVEDLVRFEGAADSAQVRQALREADAAVLPCVVAADGERDGIPVFLNEAMALGVPVVSTPVSGIPEMVEDGKTGFLCEPGDAASLALALRRVLSDAAASASVADAARAVAERELDVDKAAARLIARIES